MKLRHKINADIIYLQNMFVFVLSFPHLPSLSFSFTVFAIAYLEQFLLLFN